MGQWYDLRRASQRSNLSVKTLRKAFRDACHPLHAHLVGGKILIAEADLDQWLREFAAPGAPVSRMVDEILQDLEHRQHKRKNRRKP